MGLIYSHLRSSEPVDWNGPYAAIVSNEIKKSKVVIFSKTYCQYCTLAKKQFEKLNQPYHVIEINKRDDVYKLQDVLYEMTGVRTVPRVFINGECVGGGTDVEKLYNNGQLQVLLEKPFIN